MVALATAFVRLRLDTSSTKDDIDRGIRGAGGEKAAGNKGRSIAAAFSKGFESGGSTFGRVAATMAAKATIAAAGVAAATPAVTQFVAAVAPAAGVAAALPVTLLAIKTTSLAAKVAVLGVGDAIKAGFGTDAKAAEEALKGVHGEARKFTVQMIGLKKPLADIQRATSDRLFAPLINEIKPLAATFLPSIRAQLPQTSGALGQLGERVAHVAREGPALRALNATFDAGQAAVARMSGAVRPLVNGISNGLIATAPQVKILAGYFADGAIAVGNFLTRAARTGQLSAWITSGVITVKQLVAIFVNLGAITSSVFDRATGGSNTLLARILELTTQTREFVESARGGQVVSDLFRTMGVFGEALRKALAGVLPQIATSLRLAAPAAGVFATAVANVIISLGPLLPALTGVTVQLLTAVIPAMNAFAGWLSRNQELLKAIAPVILAYIVAAKAVAVATGAATIATRVWSVAVGVAKAAQAGWTAVSWLASAPVHVHTAAMRLSTSTIGTWIGVKRIEAASWLASTGNTIKDTAAKVANRVATLASAVASRAAAAANAAGAWIASTAAVVANTAAVVAHRVASLAAAGAAKVVTAAQWLWNAALTANPIGIVVVAIAALVAGIVILYKNNETARRIIDAMWKGIKTAIGATVDWFMGTAWPIVKRAIDFLVGYWRFLWNIVKAVWAGITLTIRTQWNLIMGVFNFVKNWLTVTLPNNFRLLLTVARAVWSGIRAFIGAQVNLVLGVFGRLRTFVTATLPNAFKTGVGAIRAAWAKVQEAAKTPVSFVVNKVINPLIGGYNKIAGIFNAPKAATITGFASGGKIPGVASGVDNRMAQVVDAGKRALGNIRVATGEFIVNAKSTAANLPIIQAINAAKGPLFQGMSKRVGGVKTSMDGREGFAEGGGIGGFLDKVWKGAKGVANFVTDPVAGLKKLFDSAMGAIPGAGPIVTVLKGMGTRVFEGVKNFLSGGMFAGGGGNGSSFGKWPSSPAAQRGDSGVWRRIVSMIKASGINQGSFGNGYRPGDPKWHGSGRAVDWMGFNMDRLATWLAQRKPLELIHRTNQRDYAYTRGKNKGSFNASLMNAHRNHIHIAMKLGGMLGKIRDRFGNLSAVKLLDRGGAWKSGTLGMNQSGHTEQVLTGGPRGDMASLERRLDAVVDAINRLADRIGPDVADALSDNTRRAVRLGRGMPATSYGQVGS